VHAKLSALTLTLCLVAVVPCAANATARRQRQKCLPTYSMERLSKSRKTIRLMRNRCDGRFWLYREGVRIPRHTSGLQYSRWGLIEETSAGRVLKALKAAQGFEEGYLKFFGPDTWGRTTFLNSLGPDRRSGGAHRDAIHGELHRDAPPELETRYQLLRLNDRLDRLITTAGPSLENNESESASSSVKEYFDQIRDALERVSKISSQLARAQPRLQTPQARKSPRHSRTLRRQRKTRRRSLLSYQA